MITNVQYDVPISLQYLDTANGIKYTRLWHRKRQTSGGKYSGMTSFREKRLLFISKVWLKHPLHQ